MGEGAEFIERLQIKIFGPDGAVRKAGICIFILIALNILNKYYEAG